MDNVPIFLDSVLKVTATEDLNIEQELSLADTNKSIDDHLKDQNAEEEKRHI